jgi:hypothetical protein
MSVVESDVPRHSALGKDMIERVIFVTPIARP